MRNLDALRDLVARLDYHPLFVTVSGAHLYGFQSPDSDVDLRGCHLLPLGDIVGLDIVNQTREEKADLDGTEVELVSHDIGKYCRLLVKNNGYVLEQIFSPIVVVGQEFLDRLRPLAKRCITRHHYHHYRGFLATQRKLLEKEQPKRLKTLLYGYRAVLTGIHLLESGEVEANLPRLADRFALSFLHDLIAQKTTEGASAATLDWEGHNRLLTDLELRLDASYQATSLPEERDRRSVDDFLIALRLEGPRR